MIRRRDEITSLKPHICPNCSSTEQHSNFCTNCGAEIQPESDTTRDISIFIKILLFPISIIFVIVRGFSLIAGVVLVLGMFFGMFMFMFAMMAQGNDGLFPWQRGQDTNGTLNSIYDECKDSASSLSLMFFNINTDQNKMRQCLEKTVGYGDGQIIDFDIPTEFKKIMLESRGLNYTDALEESNSRHAAFVKTAKGAQHFIPEYYRTCQKDTSLINWGPFMFGSNKNKARECFIERHADVVDAFSDTIDFSRLVFPSSLFYEEEEIKDILMFLKYPEANNEVGIDIAQSADEVIAAQKCPQEIDLSTYPAALEVIDFTESNYGGVYQLDDIYNCSPKWTNFNCGKHGDGTDIRCYLFLSPDKSATKSGTWVVQPLPPSDEWQAGGYFKCPGMPWESCSPGWIGGKSVTIKK